MSQFRVVGIGTTILLLAVAEAGVPRSAVLVGLEPLSSQAGSRSQLVLEPGFIDLGSYSAHGAGLAGQAPTYPEVRIFSQGPWRLLVRVVSPPRQVARGLELPLDRLRGVLSDLPEQVFTLQPFEIASGDGAAEWQSIEIDWGFAELLLQEFIEESDPPGEYTAVSSWELVGPDGTARVRLASVAVRFAVEGWLELETADGAISVSSAGGGAGGVAESALFPVLVRSNCGWRLWVRAAPEPAGRKGPEAALLAALQFRVESDGQGNWLPVAVDYQPLGEVFREAAVSDGPPAFEVAEVEVPVRVRLDEYAGLTAGAYTLNVLFRAAVTGR